MTNDVLCQIVCQLVEVAGGELMSIMLKVACGAVGVLGGVSCPDTPASLSGVSG